MLNLYPSLTLPRNADVCMKWKGFKEFEAMVEGGEGRGYGKAMYIDAQQGQYTLSLPKTIFLAVAATSTVCIPPINKTLCHYIMYTGPLIVMSVCTVMAQLGSIWYVFNITIETKDASEEAGVNQCEAPGSSYFLRLICLSVFVATVLVDLKESAAMAQYVGFIPTMNKSDLNEKDEEILDSCGTSLLAKKVRVHDTSATNKHFNMEVIGCGGITTVERMWFRFWILLKIAAEGLVLFVGAGYVLYADSNENLILNSVALLFITQIDDIAYSFAVTDVFKNMLNGVPDIGKVSDCNVKEHRWGDTGYLCSGFGCWFFIAVLCGTSGVVYTVNC